MNKPELLSPAGTLKNMRYAFAYGADAVYAGQPRYSLRVRNNEFSKEHVLGQGIEDAHSMGKLFFLASNIAPHNSKVRTYLADLEPIIEMGPDALIMSDPGLIMMVRERWPDMPIHLSVQSNAVNFATVSFWQSMGLKRIMVMAMHNDYGQGLKTVFNRRYRQTPNREIVDVQNFKQGQNEWSAEIARIPAFACPPCPEAAGFQVL